MLPIKRRIKKESFDKIIKKGVFFHANNFYLCLLDEKKEDPSRFAFVVPAKIIKTAVKRHLIKRKMSSVVEEIILNTKPGISCLVFLKKNLPQPTFGDIKKELEDLFKKAKILKEIKF